ncbi:hypothetical protein JOM56_010911 [Amanita muscaria]
MSVRPFSTYESYSFPKPPSSHSEGDWSSMFNQKLVDTSRSLTAASPTSTITATGVNPFGDPVTLAYAAPENEAAASPAPPTFDDVESIQRPFIPTLPDELSVTVGESVRVIQTFDDGWAVAKEITDVVQGFIPIDCLRSSDQELPAFLAQKRVSSYSKVEFDMTAV